MKEEKCKLCYGMSCPHWLECFPQLVSDIKELKTENKRLEEQLEKYAPKVYEQICESAEGCKEKDCPHLKPHKLIKDGGSKCRLHTCRPHPGYKVCIDRKW